MVGKLIFLAAPLLALFFNIAVQMLCVRFLSAKVLKSAFIGFAAGFLLLAAVTGIFFCAAGENAAWLSLVHCGVYALLGYCYFHFINLGETARRIRILRELSAVRSGLTLKELLKRYNAQEILDNRLERLLANGQIVLREGKYRAGKPAVLWIARAIGMLQRILKIKV